MLEISPSVESEQPVLGGIKRFPGKIELIAVVGLKIEQTQGERVKAAVDDVFECIEVVLGFAHFGTVDQNKLAMEPKVGEVMTEGTFGLSHFVGVVDADVVNTAGVDVDGVAQGGMDDG